MNDPIQQFKNALAERSIIAPDTLLSDGRLHRCDAEGRGGNGDAAYLLHLDGLPAGGFENHRDGLGWQNWRANVERSLTSAEETAHRVRIEAARLERAAEDVKRKADAREKAALLWAEAVPADQHPYLARKRITSHGTRLHDGRLVLPIRDGAGTLRSLQFIGVDGVKRFLAGGQIRGGYCAIGKPDGILCIVEGFATGASIHEATGHAVAVAFDCGNLLPVAQALRNKFPAMRLIVCADDDYRTEGNPGLSKAMEAVQAVGGILAVPDFGADRPDGATDFNDLHQAQGLQAVANCIVKTLNEPPETPLHDSNHAVDTDAPAESENNQSDNPIQRTEGQAIAWLASLNPMDYDRARKDQAKALGVRPATLDERVKELRGEAAADKRLPFPEIEPCGHAVNPAQLLDEISQTIRRFIVLDAEQADAAALWVAVTWFVDVLEIMPLVIINAPEKACGKTQLLTVIGRMAYRPLPASNATASALFRAVELWRPTILIDEADTFFRDNFELQGMVNAGYLRDGYVLRSEATGDTFEPKMFSVYSPKAIAGIALEKHLQDATMSRGIVLGLRRKLPGESVDRLRYAEPDLFEGIASKLARFAEDYAQQVRAARPALPEQLGDRDQDNWEPLFAVASCGGVEWLNRAQAAALKLSICDTQPASVGNELLADIQTVFEIHRLDKISTADLIEALCEDDEAAWATYNRGRPLAPRQLAKQLSGYGIKSKKIRISSYETAQGFERTQFADAFARYLADPGNLPEHGTFHDKPSNHVALPVPDTKICSGTDFTSGTDEPSNGAVCSGVPDKTAILGKGENIMNKTSSIRI